MFTILDNLIKRVLSRCVSPNDDSHIRLKKITLFIISSLCTISGVIWGLLYYFLLGYNLPMLMPLSFSLVVGTSLVFAFIFKEFKYLLYAQLIMIFIAPILLHWMIGGFNTSQGVFLWALLAPLGSLMFQNTTAASRWFGAFLVFFIISVAFDNYFYENFNVLHSNFDKHVFVSMNIIGPSFTIFFTMRYFVNAFKNEHKRSEGLLLNILPKSIAERLKNTQGVIGDAHSEATVLFTDIVKFTELSKKIPPHELVELLNQVFSAFDKISQKYGVEKIKTIGDSYMAVSGLPNFNHDHAEKMIEVAMAMQSEINIVAEDYNIPLKVRIGIHSGPVVAGIIGIHKFTYDLWGQTVNIASRMESHGLPGKIQVSSSVYKQVKDIYTFEPLNTIEVKGMGLMKTYLLIGRK